MPIESALLQQVAQFGMWIIFLYLFITERKRNVELHDKLQEDYERLLARLEAQADKLQDAAKRISNS